MFAGVYGPCDPSESGKIWEELGSMLVKWRVSWCIGGYFNVVRFLMERLAASRMTNQMRSFNGFIDKNGLVDLPLKGPLFTWFNNQDRRACSCLDRFLISHEWVEEFPIFSQEALPNPSSNHIPILLRMEGLPLGPLPFRFDPMWLEVPGFREKIRKWWEDMIVEGSAGFVFGQKLKLLKEKIVQWKNEEFGGIEKRKQACLQTLAALDLKGISSILFDREEEAKAKAIATYNSLLQMEEIS